ncbi:MAG TPA: acylneuraminate cytidylyltransferase family protein, partial [Elusimicrobiota bacterium]|nr:acylneuraminate cytidylyltransferase family protein [Elusimicrobiota bacterium]
MTRYAAVLPARAGSKGIPGKNLKAIAGKPLLAWSIETALACGRLSDVVVSSDGD